VRAEPGEAWVCWVETDYDAEALREVLPEAAHERHAGAVLPVQPESGDARLGDEDPDLPR
jgi:hypothetical protein